MVSIISLLEEKRVRDGLSQRAIVKILGFKNLATGAVQYSQWKLGQRPVPEKRFSRIAAFLEVSVDNLESLAKDESTKLLERRFTVEECRDFVRIVEFAGRPLTIAEILNIVSIINTAGS